MLFVNSSRRDKSFLRRKISSTQRIEYIKFHHREIVVKRSNILIPRSSKVSLDALHARIHSILRISQSATFIRFETSTLHLSLLIHPWARADISHRNLLYRQLPVVLRFIAHFSAFD